MNEEKKGDALTSTPESQTSRFYLDCTEIRSHESGSRNTRTQIPFLERVLGKEINKKRESNLKRKVTFLENNVGKLARIFQEDNVDSEDIEQVYIEKTPNCSEENHSINGKNTKENSISSTHNVTEVRTEKVPSEGRQNERKKKKTSAKKCQNFDFHSRNYKQFYVRPLELPLPFKLIHKTRGNQDAEERNRAETERLRLIELDRKMDWSYQSDPESPILEKNLIGYLEARKREKNNELSNLHKDDFSSCEREERHRSELVARKKTNHISKRLCDYILSSDESELDSHKKGSCIDLTAHDNNADEQESSQCCKSSHSKRKETSRHLVTGKTTLKKSKFRINWLNVSEDSEIENNGRHKPTKQENQLVSMNKKYFQIPKNDEGRTINRIRNSLKGLTLQPLSTETEKKPEKNISKITVVSVEKVNLKIQFLSKTVPRKYVYVNSD